ncbi:helix-turn-helix domain-containing protein [Fulvivirgaceae bacterium LMO-SS25]
MLFDFNLKSSFLLFFFLHGLIFSALLLQKGISHKHIPSRWLSLFIFLCTLYISPFMLGYANWYSTNPYRDILFYIPFQQLFLFPPVLYFYFKALLEPSYRFQKKDYLHFLPALIYLLYSIGIFLTDKVFLEQNYFYEDGKDKDFAFSYQLAGFISFFIYLILSLRTYQKYKSNIYNTYSYADSLILKWAQRFLLAFLLLIIIRVLLFILNPEWDEFGRKFWYYMLFSALFNYISIKGYVSAIRSTISYGRLFHNKPAEEVEKTDDTALANPDSKSFEQMDPQDLSHWKDKIEKLMLEEQFYSNPELSTFLIAQKLETHPKRISQVVNQAFQMNFNEYINSYRIQAVIEQIEKGEHINKTLLGIATDCGFNSKSTFNRAFKKHISMSPKEYIEKISQESVSNQDLKRKAP